MQTGIYIQLKLVSVELEIHKGKIKRFFWAAIYCVVHRKKASFLVLFNSPGSSYVLLQERNEFHFLSSLRPTKHVPIQLTMAKDTLLWDVTFQSPRLYTYPMISYYCEYKMALKNVNTTFAENWYFKDYGNVKLVNHPSFGAAQLPVIWDMMTKKHWFRVAEIWKSLFTEWNLKFMITNINTLNHEIVS